MRAFDAGGVPVRTLGPWAHEHQEQPQAVRAVPRDILVWCLDVTVRLRHLAATEDDRALIPQMLERLAEPEITHVAKCLRDEPRVEQGQDRVLDPARLTPD